MILSDGTKITKTWIKDELKKKKEILEYRQTQYAIFWKEFQIWNKDYAELYKQNIDNLEKEIKALQALLKM